jgi:hypothetical protein
MAATLTFSSGDEWPVSGSGERENTCLSDLPSEILGRSSRAALLPHSWVEIASTSN